jgi:hypothetical protein
MQSYNTYNVDFNKLPCQLMPRPNRKPRLLLLLKALLFPFLFLHNLFVLYRKAKIYQLSHNSQVVYLESMLNDKYDSDQRRIFIGDAGWVQPWWVYLEEELKPQYVKLESENEPVYVYTEGEAGTAKDDFIVWVPADVAFADAEMRSLLDSYKLTGTKYTIQIF